MPLKVVQPSLPRISRPVWVRLVLLRFVQEGVRGSRARLLDHRGTVSSGLGYHPCFLCPSAGCSLRSSSLVGGLPLAALGLCLEVHVCLHSNRLLLPGRRCPPEALRDVSRVDFLQREFLLDQGAAAPSTGFTTPVVLRAPATWALAVLLESLAACRASTTDALRILPRTLVLVNRDRLKVALVLVFDR